ncbi:hypothetical protein, partial [Citrobacter youngae]|uniref:hypothetical protein n=1 Tax=Citrobacter youngae TaxID=133448 RepID=UPI0019536400
RTVSSIALAMGSVTKGGDVGILRLLNNVNFELHWGVWERGLINILANKSVPLESVTKILLE